MESLDVNDTSARRFTVLFVEDEQPVRDTVVEVLRNHGFGVLCAADGYDAIRLLVEFPVDLLFTDIVMPGLSGFELAQQAKLIRPHLRVLYVSGYADEMRSGGGVRHGKLLSKPLRADDMVAEVRHALAA